MSAVNPRSLLLATLVACCSLTLLAGGVMADHHEKPKAAAKAKTTAAPEKAPVKTDPMHDAMMAEMMKYAMPGEAHQWLKKAEGRWDATVKMWAGPGEPQVSKGVSVHKMILGGRYLEQRFSGTFMEQPFEGYGLLGYDNKKKTYTSFWIDNSSTSMMTSSGTADETGKVVTMHASTDGPDGKPMDMRQVTKIVDDNTHVFSMYGKMGEQETLMMEITYKRAAQ